MKFYALFVLSIAAVFVVTSCGGGEPTATSAPTPTTAPTPAPTSTVTPQPTETPAAQLTTVRVAVPTRENLQFMNFWVAKGAGLFEDEGLNIPVVVPPMPGAVAQFVLMGRADVAVVPSPIFFYFIAREQPLVTFANLFQNDEVTSIGV